MDYFSVDNNIAVNNIMVFGQRTSLMTCLESFIQTGVRERRLFVCCMGHGSAWVLETAWIIESQMAPYS